METKNQTKTKTRAKSKTVEVKKMSKIMKAAEKYKGSVEILDMDALFNPVY